MKKIFLGFFVLIGVFVKGQSFPCTQTTSCAFSSNDLKQLYIAVKSISATSNVTVSNSPSVIVTNQPTVYVKNEVRQHTQDSIRDGLYNNTNSNLFFTYGAAAWLSYQYAIQQGIQANTVYSGGYPNSQWNQWNKQRGDTTNTLLRGIQAKQDLDNIVITKTLSMTSSTVASAYSNGMVVMDTSVVKPYLVLDMGSNLYSYELIECLFVSTSTAVPLFSLLVFSDTTVLGSNTQTIHPNFEQYKTLQARVFSSIAIIEGFPIQSWSMGNSPMNQLNGYMDVDTENKLYMIPVATSSWQAVASQKYYWTFRFKRHIKQ